MDGKDSSRASIMRGSKKHDDLERNKAKKYK
jgi:hypothetical protein